MKETESLLYILEMIGTIAFASSGAMVGIRKNMDIFGVSVLAITTAVGGGMIRDILLGITPPGVFIHKVYVVAAVATACLLFIIVYHRKEIMESRFIEKYEKTMVMLDAVGLGIFTILGMNTAIQSGFEDNIFLVMFVGVVTGIGGGMMRDIMAGMTPFVFVRHIYACASIFGAVCYIMTRSLLDQRTAIIISVSVVVIIRILAARFEWNLPRIK